MSLIGVVVSFIIGVAATATFELFRRRNQRRIRDRRLHNLMELLGIDGKADLTIAHGSITFGEPSQPQPAQADGPPRNGSALVSLQYGDITAVLRVFQRFCRYPGRLRHVPGVDPTRELLGNVISIGGPKWNRITESLLGLAGSPLYFKSGERGLVVGEQSLRGTLTERIQAVSDESANGGVARSTAGMVICARDHYLGEGTPTAVVIAGVTTYCVLGAAQYLLDLKEDELAALAGDMAGGKRFALLIRRTALIDQEGRATFAGAPRVTSYRDEHFLGPRNYQYR